MPIPVAVLGPPGPPGAGVFACTLCGDCCRGLQSRRGRPDWPASALKLARMGYYGLPTEGGLQAWSWERQRMLREATARGIELKFVPSLAVADELSGRLVVLVYELEHDACPFLGPGPEADSLVCHAYDARPLVCRAYPVVQSDDRLTPSSKCPDIIEPPRSDRDAFLHVFGDAFLAAEAANGLPREVARVLRTLEDAGTLRLARDLSREQILMRRDRGPPLDLWTLLTGSSVDTSAFLQRMNPDPTRVFTPAP